MTRELLWILFLICVGGGWFIREAWLHEAKYKRWLSLGITAAAIYTFSEALIKALGG